MVRKGFLRLRLPAILIAVVSCAVVLASEAAAADSKRPTTPSALKKDSATETTVTLSWRGSSDNVGVKGYRVYRNGTYVGGTTGALAFVMTGLHCNTTYIVMVSAYDAAGNRSLPNAIFARTAACGSDEPPCPTPSTVFSLLLEHKITYGCTWPGAIFAKQAVQSVRIMLAGRNIKLETWRGKKWMAVALAELDAAANMPGAWNAQGALNVNSAGLAAQYKIGRVIRVLQWNNPELFEVSKSEKWALTAISWYISASSYNTKFAAVGGSSPMMVAALRDLKRADADFFSLVCYRAWGRYRQVWQRVNGL